MSSEQNREDQDQESSEDSSPFFGPAACLSEARMEEIEKHVGTEWGHVEDVIHEMFSEHVHLDLLPVRFEEDGKQYLLLCTMGMSAVPMEIPEDEVPEDADSGDEEPYTPTPLVELFMILPGECPLPSDSEHPKLKSWKWAHEFLKDLARYPAMTGIYLGPCHSVPNGFPAEPFSEECAFVGVMLVLAEWAGLKEFGELKVKEGRIDFLMVVPLYPEEMDCLLEDGAEVLFEKLGAAEVPVFDLANPGRPNVCAGRKRKKGRRK